MFGIWFLVVWFLFFSVLLLCVCSSLLLVFKLIMSKRGIRSSTNGKNRKSSKSNKSSRKRKNFEDNEQSWDDFDLSKLGQSDIIDLLINREIDYDGEITRIGESEEVIRANNERLRNILKRGRVSINFKLSMALGAEMRLRLVYFKLF